jgi:hypothetical protein
VENQQGILHSKMGNDYHLLSFIVPSLPERQAPAATVLTCRSCKSNRFSEDILSLKVSFLRFCSLCLRIAYIVQSYS